MKSKVKTKNGNPCICIGEQQFPACAYVTYFEERNDYAEFTKHGFRMYSVSVSLASQPINTQSGLNFGGGVFDQKGRADFSYVDQSISMILRACPDAYIFPRIYVTMPQWWIEEHPTETTEVPHGKRREMLFSDCFRHDAAQMLKELIEHFRTFFASDRVFGYQISGGNTQEWFHLDLNGSLTQNALPYFNRFLEREYGESTSKLPELSEAKGDGIITDTLLKKYVRFANKEVAKTIELLCEVAKKASCFEQIVGVFYGYTAEVVDGLWGTHALYDIIDSPSIDFFSSPNSYTNGRSLGVDWGDMMPVDSIKLHNKMCFIESDIRTFLTRTPEESRKGSDPQRYYTAELWQGPPTEEMSVYAVRKSLARQLTHGHGLWWFDMFGHWYSTDNLMKEMKTSHELYCYALDTQSDDFDTEVALFLDEKAYSEVGAFSEAASMPYKIRALLGYCGVPYHVYLTEDFDKVIQEKNYKAVVFCRPLLSKEAKKMCEKLNEKGIASYCIHSQTKLPSVAELKAFFKKSNVFVYCDSEDVFYIGNGFVAIHTQNGGKKELSFPKKIKITDVNTKKCHITDHLTVDMKDCETLLFHFSFV
ncbi:MAG: hypothetical protein IKW60_05875 [Clostridia bacterium]|nr:hypothetical protein [Clostridia bacterium]